MLALVIGDRLFSAANAIEEIAHVIDDRVQLADTLGAVATVEVVELELLPWQRIFFQLVVWHARDRAAISFRRRAVKCCEDGRAW